MLTYVSDKFISRNLLSSIYLPKKLRKLRDTEILAVSFDKKFYEC